jgi:hypothetical protein
MNECFFCGPTENPLTEEHVWPQWVSRLLFGQYGSDHFIHVRSTGDDTTGLWRSRSLDVTTDTVCDKCNNEWLSNFENTDVKALATPLILGKDDALLPPAAQWTLAAWVYKMAMLLEVANRDDPRRFFTAADRKRFRDTTLADEHVRVFLSKYEYGQHPAHAHLPVHNFTECDGERRSFDVKVSTITAGALGVQVIAVRSTASGELVYASEVEVEFLGKAKEAIVRIWPPSPDAVRWPPSETLTQQDVEDWTEMWANPTK